LPYKKILETLLGRVAGARSVLLLDAQGEVVVGAGELDERERLIGAYQGISLGMVSRAAERVGGGEVKSVGLAPLPRHGRADDAQGRLLPRRLARAPRRCRRWPRVHCDGSANKLNQEL
jgi:hypothetical protein